MRRGTRPRAFDATAIQLIRRAGFEPGTGIGPVLLVRRLIGDSAVHTIGPGILPGGGALVKVDGEWRVYIVRDYPYDYKRFVVLHELAHWALGPTASEDDCDSLASALLDQIEPELTKAPDHQKPRRALITARNKPKQMIARPAVDHPVVENVRPTAGRT